MTVNLIELIEFINREYGLAVMQLTETKRGYYGETWCAESPFGKKFIKLVKSAEHRKRYEQSFSIMEYLNAQGIDAVSKPLKTVDSKLFVEFNNATLGVFEWINGDNIQNEQTKIAEYNILAEVYAVSASGLDIPIENFTTDVVDIFRRQCDKLHEQSQSETVASLLRLFDSKQTIIEHRAERLAHFSELCQSDRSHFYITHGDAGGNIIIDGGKYHLVDWDSPMYAPPERDAWFCLHWEWATKAFHDALNHRGIYYTLRTERLAYYCYKFFFLYLTFYLESYFDGSIDGDKIVGEVMEYFSCWIEDNIRFADAL